MNILHFKHNYMSVRQFSAESLNHSTNSMADVCISLHKLFKRSSDHAGPLTRFVGPAFVLVVSIFNSICKDKSPVSSVKKGPEYVNLG